MKATVFDRFRLDGRIALVTCASGGLGLHLARLLSAAGARVALAARRGEQLLAAVREIEAAGGQVRAVSLDVTCGAKVPQCLDELSAWGIPDIVVDNAGATVTRPLLDQTEEVWERVMSTNLKGCWLVAAGKGGTIINVASILGERVAAISKASVVQATKAMALELARYRNRVNALLPGYVVTALNHEFLESDAGQKLRARIPSRRLGELTALDGPLLLLASDAGTAMSGATVAVDGAHLVSSL